MARAVGHPGLGPAVREGAVEHAAKKIGCTPTVLYRYARVAEGWTREEFDAVLNAASPNGKALTFSHFATASNVSDVGQRDELLARARTGGWSVRQLKSEINKATGVASSVAKKGKDKGATDVEALRDAPATKAGLKKVATYIEKCVAECERLGQELEELRRIEADKKAEYEKGAEAATKRTKSGERATKRAA